MLLNRARLETYIVGSRETSNVCYCAHAGESGWAESDRADGMADDRLHLGGIDLAGIGQIDLMVTARVGEIRRVFCVMKEPLSASCTNLKKEGANP